MPALSLNLETIQVNAVGSEQSHAYPMRKTQYGEKLTGMLEISDKILVIGIDHIGSTTLSALRKRYRGRARFLFGKNTLIRRTVRNYIRLTGRVEISNLLQNLKGNCGLVFLEGNPSIYDMMKIQTELVAASRITSAARAGDVAPCDIVVPPGDTGLEPTQTNFFASMNIATRIRGGQIQIVNEVLLVRAGGRVDASHAALLNQLGLKPFTYAIQPIAIYDGGECYPANAADACSPDEIHAAFVSGMNEVAAFSFGVGRPNLLTVPHSVAGAYLKLVQLGVSCLGEYSWPGLDELKTMLLEREKAEKVGGSQHMDNRLPSPSPPSLTRSPSPPAGGIDFWTSDDSDESDDE